MSEQDVARWGPDAPTPGQLKEFFAQIASGRVTAVRMTPFLKGEDGKSTAIAVIAAIPSLFATPDEQIAHLRERNKACGFAFTEAQFAEVEKAKPTAVFQDLQEVWVLAWYLDTLEATVEASWQWAGERSGNPWKWDALKFDEKSLRHSGETSQDRSLRWVCLDIRANTSKPPNAIREGINSLPGIEPIQLAAYSPEWVKSMDGKKVPYVWLAGLEANIFGSTPWSDVPLLHLGVTNRGVRLSALRGWNAHDYWAVPVFREL